MTVQSQYDERKKILFDLIPSQGRIFLAGMVDALMMGFVTYLAIRLYILPIAMENDTVVGATILLVLTVAMILEIFFLFTGGTFGMFVMRIAYVDGDTGRRFNHSMVWAFYFESWWINLKYTDLYEAFAFFTSPTNQSKAMQKTNTYYVRIEEYNRLNKARMIPFY